MENTLLLIKPSAVQRGLIGEVIHRLEQKGLQIVGLKMMDLSCELLNEHYAHLKEKPFFGQIVESMQASPVIALCLRGVDAVEVVRQLTGSTNGRKAVPGTLRGDFSLSVLENIVHTSDSQENATIEIKRFFAPEEIFSYQPALLRSIYCSDEL